MRLTARTTLTALSGVVALTFATACDSSDPGTAIHEVSVENGHAAFLASCARCHASRDGFDLAYFGFPDTAIIRRARNHVSDDEAHDIAAYIQSLGVPAHGRDYVLFHPHAQPAAS